MGETQDVADRHPEVVARLTALAQACRVDLGDSALGIEGANCRPLGCVEPPATLTTYDPSHPYICAEYGLPEAG